jgi:hypothetical protein
MTPTQRTLARLRAEGWVAVGVERWNPHARIRQDLFGCIDVLAVSETGGILGVQACAAASHAARRAKAIAEPSLLAWLRAGGRFQVMSWRKAGARGKRKLWAARVEEITLASLGLPSPESQGSRMDGVPVVTADTTAEELLAFARRGVAAQAAADLAAAAPEMVALEDRS